MNPEPWICPRCQRVNAPHVDHCDCQPPAIVSPFIVPWQPSPTVWPQRIRRTWIGDPPGWLDPYSTGAFTTTGSATTYIVQ